VKNNFNKRYSRKNILIGLICFLFVVLMAFLITEAYLQLKRDIKIHESEMKYMVDQRINSLMMEYTIFPPHLREDLLFLSEMSSTKKVVSGTEELKNTALPDLEEDFLKFLMGETSYYGISYISETGKEVVRVEFDGRNYFRIPEEDLENKKDRDYFVKSMLLDKGDIFIFKLSLNTKRGLIENRGTKRNPVYIPIIYAATPVFDDAGNKKGIVIFDTYIGPFFDNIRRSQREGEKVFLINMNGDYLSHPDREKEFSSILSSPYNFYEDYSEIPKEIILNPKKRTFESENLIFSFRNIYPTAEDSAIHRGAEKIFGDNPEKNYFWILVSVVDKKETIKTVNELKKDYLYFLLFSAAMVFFIIVLLFLLFFKSHDIEFF